MTVTAMSRILDALRVVGELVEVVGEPPAAVTGVTDDSRRVTAGMLFCAVRGTAADGHDFLEEAAARGAGAALVTKRVGLDLPQVVVRRDRIATAVAAGEWFGRPAKRLRIVGVTGTNGKTTTVALIHHLLNGDGTVGSIGTLGAIDGSGDSLPGASPLTTPGPVELQAVLAAMCERGVRSVVMEASSHALDQGRLHTLELSAAVYTNLTHDHLDYHGGFEAYRAAKFKLSDLLESGALEVVNADDPAWNALPARREARRVRFGTGPDADARLLEADPGARFFRLRLLLGELTVTARLPLFGEFNVTNALASCATAWALGMDAGEVAARLDSAPQVPGRMERLVEDEFTIVRDYAHTPDALARAIAAVRNATRGRVIVLFGAGGDRDRQKRPLMGEIVARDADLAVVTSDNPRTEDPESIIDDIEAGMSGMDHLRIVDRRAAIIRAVRLLQPGDSLLLAGKGHEVYQVIGTDRLPFDERLIVNEALQLRVPE